MFIGREEELGQLKEFKQRKVAGIIVVVLSRLGFKKIFSMIKGSWVEFL
ncbi:MAG: hypothetical protein WCK42_06555 [Myxococcaceae bacterium]